MQKSKLTYKLSKEGNNVLAIKESTGVKVLFKLNNGNLEYTPYSDSYWEVITDPKKGLEKTVLNILKMLGLKEKSAKQLMKEQIKFRNKD